MKRISSIQILRGNCVIQQGQTTLRCQQAVVWQRAELTGDQKTNYLTLFLKDDVQVEEPSRSLREQSLVRQMQAQAEVQLSVANTPVEKPRPMIRCLSRRFNSRRESVAATCN
ncbi:MAG: hypothetical protein R3C11_29255 [Planctomycetaceae bacterium]